MDNAARKQIYDAIPHREPFLLVDEIVQQTDSRIVCTKTFTGREDFFAGHYPGYPLVPGVLLCEAAMQCGAILLSRHFAEMEGRVPVATRINDVRFKRMVRPGEILTMEIELVERLADAFFLKAKVSVDGKVAVRFEFACTGAERDEGRRARGEETGESGENRTSTAPGVPDAFLAPRPSFLQLTGKSILIFGVANRKSVAWHIARVLSEAGARCVYVVQNEETRQNLGKLLGEAPALVCDVERPEQIGRLREELVARNEMFHGLVHSIAFADYSEGPKPFHETPKTAFLRAMDVSCYSLIALCDALKDRLDPDASVVTISISTTQMASENYGYMAPIKAALDSSLAFLAKSFSRFSRVRFNAVAPGLLKTAASAGIPGYVDSYLYAEQVIPRKAAVRTEEAAHVAAFLLSPRSSGINAQRIVVDAGMSINYFDRDLIRRVVGS